MSWNQFIFRPTRGDVSVPFSFLSQLNLAEFSWYSCSQQQPSAKALELGGHHLARVTVSMSLTSHKALIEELFGGDRRTSPSGVRDRRQGNWREYGFGKLGMKSQSGAHRKVTHSKQDCDDRQGRIITIHIWYRRREGLFAFVIVWVVSDYSNLVICCMGLF